MDNLELIHNFLCIVKISLPVIPHMWENKPGAGADPHPFWTWWYLIYMLLLATFPLNVRIIWSDTFSDCSSFYVACVSNHCHWTGETHRSKMGLAIHLSCFYDAFSSYHVSFFLVTSLTMISSMTSLMMMVLGPGYLVRSLFCFLKILLVMLWTILI